MINFFQKPKIIFTSGIISLLLCSSVGHADSKASKLDLETLTKMNKACFDLASKENYNVAIAIYDEGGVLLSFTQTDGAAPATGEVARWKGLSSAYYRASTALTGSWNVPTAPKIATVRGGVPIFSKDGSPLGGIGVSGAPSEFDEKCSTVAVEAVGFFVQSPN